MSKKILVTGANGFLGSSITKLAVKKGFKVNVLIRKDSNADNLKNIFSKINVFYGDIRDYDSVQNAVKGKQFILHLAALIGIPYSYISPMAYIKTNIEGTYNVLEAARAYQTEQVIITSKSET